MLDTSSCWAIPPFAVRQPKPETDLFSKGGGTITETPTRFFGVLVG
jgi:hypothetical protein